MENNHFTFSNFNEVFGKLESVHGIRRDKFQTFGVPAIVFLLFLFAVMGYVTSEDWLTIPLVALPCLVLFVYLIWYHFKSRRCQLIIYENGFLYRNGNKSQACLWTEIKTYNYREQKNNEIMKLENGVIPLSSVEKKSGEVINFDLNLTGTPKIITRFENHKTKK